MNKTRQHRIRVFMTMSLLMAYGALMIALTAIDTLNAGRGISIAGIFIGGPLFALLISFIWGYKLVRIDERDEATTLEKRKRERIDSVLRELSDEDLMRLKQRLIDGTINDEMIEQQIVGEDGELMYMEKRP